MPYSDLIMQESEYTYSANIQFDIENDRKLLRFIPNDTIFVFDGIFIKADTVLICLDGFIDIHTFIKLC